MAEFIAHLLIENLKPIMKSERDMVLQVKDDIETIRKELEFMTNFLKDLEEKIYQNEALKNWKTQIRGIAYQVEEEDIIDSKGGVDGTNSFLKYFPEPVTTKAVQHLLRWSGQSPDLVYLLDWGDYAANTALLDRFRTTCLHIAAQKGRVDVRNTFVKYWPEPLKVGTATRMAYLARAVMHNKKPSGLGKYVQHVLRWSGQWPDFVYLLDWLNYAGNTSLRLPTSINLLQNVRVKGTLSETARSKQTITWKIFDEELGLGHHSFEESTSNFFEDTSLHLACCDRLKRLPLGAYFDLRIALKPKKFLSVCPNEMEDFLNIGIHSKESRVKVKTTSWCQAAKEATSLRETRVHWFEFCGKIRLHLACENGDLNLVEDLMILDRNLCFKQDRFGRMPLHIAAQRGRVDIINIFLKYCPESVKEVTATMETCLHMAVMRNKIKVVQHLLKWIGERPDLFHLLNWGDYEGNTALHLSTSKKQLQTSRVLLSAKFVDVNTLNFGGFTALGILYVLLYSRKVDMEIDMILQQAGAMRAQDLTSQIIKHYDDCCHGQVSNRLSNIGTVKSFRSKSALLVIATLLATVTYQAAFHLLGATFKKGYVYNNITGTVQMNKQDSITSSSFVLFNSMVFLGSVCMTIFLLHDFPWKPWPQISVMAMFGSYVCTIMAISRNEALALLFVSIPFLLLAAIGKLYCFAS